MKIKLKIRRQDPVGDRRAGGKKDSYLQAYTVEAGEGMTILEALLNITETQDPSLSFRRSCRSAICGSCAVNVNGFPGLACNTQLIPEYERGGSLTIGPLSNHTVLKDLIVEFSPFWRKMEQITPYLVEGETPSMTQDEQKRIDKSQKCIMCGSCNSICNALEADESYTGPAALAKAWRFIGDVRDADTHKRLERLSADHGMWDCTRCIHCTEYCPKDVAPLEAIENLRSSAIDQGLLESHGAKHTLSMIDSIKRVGRLDEAAMTFKTLGFLRSLGMMPFGIKMELHGKMPHPILFPAIEGIEEVRRIVEVFEKKKKKGRRRKERRTGP